MARIQYIAVTGAALILALVLVFPAAQMVRSSLEASAHRLMASTAQP